MKWARLDKPVSASQLAGASISTCVRLLIEHLLEAGTIEFMASPGGASSGVEGSSTVTSRRAPANAPARQRAPAVGGCGRPSTRRPPRPAGQHQHGGSAALRRRATARRAQKPLALDLDVAERAPAIDTCATPGGAAIGSHCANQRGAASGCGRPRAESAARRRRRRSGCGGRSRCRTAPQRRAPSAPRRPSAASTCASAVALSAFFSLQLRLQRVAHRVGMHHHAADEGERDDHEQLEPDLADQDMFFPLASLEPSARVPSQ